jgi:membrane-associated protease RseP (regulator of RpoE activity)
MLNSTDRLERIAHYRMALEGVMQVLGYTFDAENPNGPVKLHGKLLKPPDVAYRHMRATFEKLGFTPYLARMPDKPDQCEVTVVPGTIPKTTSNPLTNVWLFLATVASVIFTGGYSDSGFRWADGLMFAGSLLGILVVHEAGHYIVGRIRGAPVSLPYFIPMPFISFIGTMGAVIVQREPFEDRRSMMEIGIAGPLAGFVLAVPLYVIGLMLSNVQPIPTTGGLMYLGDSLFTYTLGLLVVGRIDPASGSDVFLHPIAFGAWIGMLITGINLIPAGQLDGGHVVAAILGRSARIVSIIMIVALLGLAFLSQMWLLWAVMLFLFGRSHPEPLNAATPLEPLHYALGIAALLVFILVFVPIPVTILR